MKYKMLYNFYVFSIDILYNMIYNKIIKGTQPNFNTGGKHNDELESYSDMSSK